MSLLSLYFNKGGLDGQIILENLLMYKLLILKCLYVKSYENKESIGLLKILHYFQVTILRH